MKKKAPTKKPKKRARKPPKKSRAMQAAPTVEPHPHLALTKQRLNDLLRQARIVPFVRPCAEATNVGERTLRRWLSQGRSDTDAGHDTLQARLWQGWQATRGKWAQNRMRKLVKAADDGDVSTNKWLLSKLDPDLYGESVRVDAEVHIGATVPDAALEDPEVVEALETLASKTRFRASEE